MKFLLLRRIIFLGVLLGYSSLAQALACQDMRQLIYGNYLRLHYSKHQFDKNLSERTLTNFFKYWDSAKIYFTKDDVEAFNRTYLQKLPKMIDNSDCSAIDQFFTIYSKRFNERVSYVEKHINDNFDFSKDHFINLNRKDMDWALSAQVIEERLLERLKYQVFGLRQGMKDMKAIREKLKKRYQLSLSQHKKLTLDDLYGAFLNSFATALDPHSYYFSLTQLEEFRISTRLSFQGIGALLRNDDGITKVQSLIPGGAAAKGKALQPDDKIVGVAQGKKPPVDIIDMDLDKVVKLIRGPGGTEVRLSLRRGEKDLVVSIIREKIQLKDRIAKSNVYTVNLLAGKETKKYKIGIIDLQSFYIDFQGQRDQKKDYRSSSRDVADELAKLQKEGVESLILDVRSNTGGAFDEAIKIAGLFVGEGPIVQIKGNKTKAYVSDYKSEDGVALAYAGPLIVLIDRHSASASEILAAAIRDYDRGLIVGSEHSFGKGTVQSLSEVGQTKELGAIKVTISKFYGPGGDSNQIRGVPSHITFPSVGDSLDIGEKYADYALPWEKIAETKFKSYQKVTPYLAALQNSHNDRVKKDPAFIKVAEAIKKFEEEKETRYQVNLKEEEPVKAPKGKGKQTVVAKITPPKEEEKPYDDKRVLGNDLDLRETVLIATEYLRSLQKLPLGGRLEILDPKGPAKKVAAKKAPAKAPPAVQQRSPN